MAATSRLQAGSSVGQLAVRTGVGRTQHSTRFSPDQPTMATPRSSIG